MGYLFLFISLIAGATKGFCGKKTSGYTDTLTSAVFANLIRMCLCIVVGILLILFSNHTGYLALPPKLLAVSVLSGISTTAFVISWLMSVRKNAYMMIDIFLTAGVIITLVLCNIFFNEGIKPLQWLGFAIVLIGVTVICSYNSSVKEKLSLSSMLLPVCCCISNGMTDFSQKLFVKLSESTPVSVFNFYTYLFSALTLLLVYIVGQKKDENKSPQKSYFKKIFGYILVMSICLFAHSYFKTAAAGFLDAIEIYPLMQGSALILSTIMAAIFFGEKITVKSIVGTAVTFAGLIIINVI